MTKIQKSCHLFACLSKSEYLVFHSFSLSLIVSELVDFDLLVGNKGLIS